MLYNPWHVDSNCLDSHSEEQKQEVCKVIIHFQPFLKRILKWERKNNEPIMKSSTESILTSQQVIHSKWSACRVSMPSKTITNDWWNLNLNYMTQLWVIRLRLLHTGCIFFMRIFCMSIQFFKLLIGHECFHTRISHCEEATLWFFALRSIFLSLCTAYKDINQSQW